MSEVRKFRKKPVEIEAIQFTGENSEDVFDWVISFGAEHPRMSTDLDRYGNSSTITIHTLEGDMLAGIDDWIIRGVQGEFYPCKPDIFEATYEEV